MTINNQSTNNDYDQVVLDYSNYDHVSSEYLQPNGRQLSFYKKAVVVAYRKFNHIVRELYSYDTRVAVVHSIVVAPSTEEVTGVYKIWDAYSVTTKKHIDAFFDAVGAPRMTKSEWEEAPACNWKAQRISYAHEVQLNDDKSIVQTVIDSKGRLVSLIEERGLFNLCMYYYTMHYGSHLYRLWYKTDSGRYFYQSLKPALNRLNRL